MKDWLFKTDEYICDLRTVGVLVRDGKMLVQRDRDGSEYALPGGPCDDRGNHSGRSDPGIQGRSRCRHQGWKAALDRGMLLGVGQSAGTSRPEQLLDNIKAVENTTFAADELALIDQISL